MVLPTLFLFVLGTVTNDKFSGAEVNGMESRDFAKHSGEAVGWGPRPRSSSVTPLTMTPSNVEPRSQRSVAGTGHTRCSVMTTGGPCGLRSGVRAGGPAEGPRIRECLGASCPWISLR